MLDVMTRIPKKLSGIYCLIFPSGHYYYGQSINIKERHSGHLTSIRKGTCNRFMISVVRKYKEMPVVIVVCICDPCDLNQAESIFLEEHTGNPGCLNFGTVPGSAHFGTKASQETKKKQSISMTGKSPSQNTRDRISDSLKLRNHHHSQDHKLKLSKLLMGRPSKKKGIPIKDDVKQRISNSLKGRIFTNETKQKITKSLMGRIPSKETREKLSIAGKGKSNPACEKSVICLTDGMRFKSQADAARFYKIPGPSISAVISGRQKTAGKRVFASAETVI